MEVNESVLIGLHEEVKEMMGPLLLSPQCCLSAPVVQEVHARLTAVHARLLVTAVIPPDVSAVRGVKMIPCVH